MIPNAAKMKSLVRMGFVLLCRARSPIRISFVPAWLLPIWWKFLQRPYNLIRADLLGEWLVVRQHPEGADPGQADLAGADLGQANLAGAHLDGADLTGAHLTDIHRMAGSPTQDCWRPAPRRGGRASPWPSSVSPENVRPPNLFLAGPSGRRQDGPSGTNRHKSPLRMPVPVHHEFGGAVDV